MLCERSRRSVSARRASNKSGSRRRFGTSPSRLAFCANCVNLDIVPSNGVDVIADAHDLEAILPPECFDTVVLTGVLQYCRNPEKVLAQAHYVLKARGWVLLAAPFIQPYCTDGPDLWRFSADGLRRLCGELFEVLEVSTSIGTGSALAFTAEAAGRRRAGHPSGDHRSRRADEGGQR